MTDSSNNRILVIDDNPAIHEDFRKILGSGSAHSSVLDEPEAAMFGDSGPAGAHVSFEIASASHGAEGLEMMQQALTAGHRYALAFVDMRMPPGWDGLATVSRLWEADPELQVVICTAYSDYSWEEINRMLGHSDSFVILKKPFENVEVLQLAHALTKKWSLNQQVKSKLSELEEKKTLEARSLRTQRLESIGTLAGGIAHDLNNILAPIMMAVPMLRWGLTPEELEKIISTVELSAQRGADLVKQLLSFGRGVEGKRVLIQAKHLVNEMVKIAQQTFPKNISVKSEVSADLWPVLGDSTQLHRVLLNLCVNARDAMPEGGALLVEVENIRLDEQYVSMNPEATPGPYVQLRVSDTGTGIPPEIIHKIFEPFFTTKEMGKGTGLGLSTALGIVKSHGGFLDVRSQAGEGTAFEVYLPATPAEQIQATEPVVTTMLRGHGECIMVVDDESMIREVTQSCEPPSL